MRRTSTILGTLICGLTMVATLGTAGGAQAATQSVQSPASISIGNCFADFGLYRYDGSKPLGFIATNLDLYFNGTTGTAFCQARIASGSNIVEIFASNGECLALNATAKTIYLHAASGCDADNLPYAQWHFMPVGSDPTNGDPVYAIQNQYVPSGKPCMYDNITTDPATIGSCSSYLSDSFLWFGYQKLNSLQS